MARVVHLGSGRTVTLNRRTLFGRAIPGATKLTSHAASKEHASIDWDGSKWIVRDLGSSNGTRINGAPLSDREWQLKVGDLIAFGDETETWEWLDDAEPVPFAVTPGGDQVPGSPGLLALPDQVAPELTIYARPDRWELDDGTTVRAVVNDEIIIVGGVNFRLQLPEPPNELPRTHTRPRRLRLAAARAVFRVSADEEHVEIQLGDDSALEELPPRAFSYLLLTLARQREADQREGVAEAEAGWDYVDEVADRLKFSLEKLNVNVHRARHVVAGLGRFEDPDNLIERRHRQLRIGISNLRIERNAPRSPPVPVASDSTSRSA